MSELPTSNDLSTDCDDLMSDVRSWINQDNADAREAFKQSMRGRAYGYDACLDAWCWFLFGWNARAEILQTEAARLKSERDHYKSEADNLRGLLNAPRTAHEPPAEHVHNAAYAAFIRLDAAQSFGPAEFRQAVREARELLSIALTKGESPPPYSAPFTTDVP